MTPLHSSLSAPSSTTKRLLALCLLAFSTFFSACAAPDMKTYSAQKPELKLENFFNGKLVGHGMVMKRSGEVTRRFVVQIVGTLSDGGNTLVLDEQFSWSDGVKDSRVWTLKRQNSGVWHGTASDVIGHAVGTVSGNALNWRYVLALPVDGTTYHLNFDDDMFLIDERTMLNKAVFSKFGFRLGEVLISFSKQ